MSWRVVWVAFVVALFGWGVGFYGPAVYLPTWHRMHGWPISTISAAITAHYLVSAALIASLPEAYRRFGVGRITLLGAVLAGLGAVAWANAAEPWHLVPALIISGAGWAATSGAALNAIVAPWFDRERPKAISMAFNGASIGGVVFVPLWTMLIAALDLPAAALILGGAMICIVCPLAWRFLRHEPPAASRHQAAPLARTELLRQGRFITVSLAFALGLFAQIGLFAHLLARIGPDFGPSLAAAAISLVTLCAVLGRTVMASAPRRTRSSRRRGRQSRDAGGRLGVPCLWRGHGRARRRLRAVRPRRRQPHLAAAPDRPARIPAGRCRHGRGAGHRDQPGDLRLRPGDLRLAA